MLQFSLLLNDFAVTYSKAIIWVVRLSPFFSVRSAFNDFRLGPSLRSEKARNFPKPIKEKTEFSQPMMCDLPGCIIHAILFHQSPGITGHCKADGNRLRDRKDNSMCCVQTLYLYSFFFLVSILFILYI